MICQICQRSVKDYYKVYDRILKKDVAFCYDCWKDQKNRHQSQAEKYRLLMTKEQELSRKMEKLHEDEELPYYHPIMKELQEKIERLKVKCER